MTKRMITMLLAAVILLSANGCAPAPDTAENSSSSSVTTEELQVLQEENEKLKQELAELKGEAPSENSQVEGEEPKEEKEEAKTESGTASEPAAKPTAPAEKPAEKPAASAANNQAAKPQAEKPAANNTQTAAKPQTPAPQKTSSGKGPLAKYTVRVKDKTTPAVNVQGELYEGELAYVFYSDSGKVLGTVPDSSVGVILRQEGLTQAEDDEQKSWFVENFNIYRGLDGGSYEVGSGSAGGGSSSSSKVDIEELRNELIYLVNVERKKVGIAELVPHDTAMEFAQIRAEELSQKFSHQRPDGTFGEYSHYAFGENIAKGQDTPQDVMDDWMSSSTHRAAILDDVTNDKNTIGAGVYQDNKGTLYWVLEFVTWDSED